LAIGASASADTLTLTWNRNPEPEVVGYLVYVGTQSGTYTRTVDVGNFTSYAFSEAVPGQTYYFAVAAYTPGPVVGPKSAEVSGSTNAPPTLANPEDQTSLVGESVTLQLVATDPEGQPVSYGATGLPPGLSVNSSTGLILGAGTTAGVFDVTAIVTDGMLSASRSFTWTMRTADVLSLEITLPTTEATFVSRDSHIVVGGTAAASAGIREVTWSSSRGGSGSASGTESWLATVALRPGQNTITVTALDTQGRTARKTLTVHKR
jgi:hypothetical protein